MSFYSISLLLFYNNKLFFILTIKQCNKSKFKKADLKIEEKILLVFKSIEK